MDVSVKRVMTITLNEEEIVRFHNALRTIATASIEMSKERISTPVAVVISSISSSIDELQDLTNSLGVVKSEFVGEMG